MEARRWVCHIKDMWWKRTKHPVPEDAAVAEARSNPGGWVYKIAGDYGPNDAVPPEVIVGAWKVGDDGVIVGDFVPNPNYKSDLAKRNN